MVPQFSGLRFARSVNRRFAIDIRREGGAREMTAPNYRIDDEDAPVSPTGGIAAFAARQWTARSVPWIGAFLIAVIAALAATDIIRSYRVSVRETGRELETQARIIAEQTARSVQAIDVVLRHISVQFTRHVQLNDEELNYLRNILRLVQADGLALHAATAARASRLYPAPYTTANSQRCPRSRVA